MSSLPAHPQIDSPDSQSTARSLSWLAAQLPSGWVTAPASGGDPAVRSVTADSRQVMPGALFVAISGGNRDGHAFIPAAVAQGAVAVVGTHALADLAAAGLGPPPDIPYGQVVDSRAALAWLAAALHDFPSRDLAVIGVTGTDGKTTTCTLIESILAAATASSADDPGRVGVITTVAARLRGEAVDTGLHVTTPDAPQVQGFLARMRDLGCTYAVVESTSHGLDQGRVAGVDFDVAAVTNITHEHLDYHGTLDAYVAAKAKLFRSLFASAAKAGTPRCAVLNGDDPISFPALTKVLADEAGRHDLAVAAWTYGLAQRSPADDLRDVFATDIEHRPDATTFLLHWRGGAFPVVTRLIGEFNVANILCAATVALSQGIDSAGIQRGVAALDGVLGRMQRMDLGQPFLAVVDFAHSPASLERALITLRPLVGRGPGGEPGRLIAVFGSAGLRDGAKRRLMGRVSGRLADFSVITAEDPRTEDLAAINREIAAGVAEFAPSDAFVVEPDRVAAIQRAVEMAQPGDVVAAFGKGHERSLCFGEIEYPWNEQEAMLDALRRRLGLPLGDPSAYRLPTTQSPGP